MTDGRESPYLRQLYTNPTAEIKKNLGDWLAFDSLYCREHLYVGRQQRRIIVLI